MKEIIKKPKNNLDILVNLQCIVIEDNYFQTFFRANIDQLPYCCGVFEIGEFNYGGSYAWRNSSVIDTVFRRLLRENKYVFIANLINNYECNVVKASFKRTGLFKMVKRFKNPNSGNFIEVWVSEIK